MRDWERLKQISPIDFHEPYGLQKEFVSSDAKFNVILGGNRAGKTEIVATKVLRKCLDNKKQHVWVVGTTFQDSIAIQQAKIWSLVPKHLIKYGRYDEINGFTNRKLLFKNGSLIIFKSDDQQRESFQGDQVDLIWLDEECSYDIYQECKMRLIDRDGEMIISMTSLKGVTELIEEIYEECDVVRTEYAELVNEQLPRVAVKGRMKIFFLWSTQNPYIPQDRVVQEAKLMTKQEIKSRIYGLPISFTGRIYFNFNRDVHVINGIEDMPEGHYSLTNVLDPHDRKPWAMVWAATHITGSTYIIDEYPERDFNEMDFDDKTYDDYAALIKHKEKSLCELFGVKAVERRIIDPNFGNKTVQLAQRQGGQAHTTPRKELEKRGLFYRDGIDALEAGHIAVRNALHYEKKGDQFKVRPNLYFCSNCLNTIKHVSRYSRKDIHAADGDVKDKAAPMDKYKDFSDDVRYLIMSKPVCTKPVREEEKIRRVY